LKRLTNIEISRRVEPHVARELAWVIEMCWHGALPAFKVKKLSRLLKQPKKNPDKRQLRFFLATEVLPSGDDDVAMAFRKFLKPPKELQYSPEKLLRTEY
jgi:hypothetical protein